MASQGNYKLTTGKAIGNDRHSSVVVGQLEEWLGFFWFALLEKTRTRCPELRSKLHLRSKLTLQKAGSKEDGETCSRKSPGKLLEEPGSAPGRSKSLLHAKSLAIILAAMG